MIYLGDKKAGTVYLGDKKLSKIYLGEKLVWEGYPEGHIIGTATKAGATVQAKYYYTDNGDVNLSCIADTNKKFDFPVPYIVKSGSRFFNWNSNVATIDSFKATFEDWSSSELYCCENLKKVKLNGIKFADSGFSMSIWLYSCNGLQYIDARGVEWSKIGNIDNTFSYLPSLAELDLSGANFNNTAFTDSNFSDIGTVGTVVKVIGCSETTQNKILNALTTNNSSQTWELKNGIITRTK